MSTEAHGYNPSDPSFEGTDHFIDINVRPGGAFVAPALTGELANHMQIEAMVGKEKCKFQVAKGDERGQRPNRSDRTC